MNFLGILVLCTLALISKGIEGKVQFYALDKPCFEQEWLCSSMCKVVYLKNDVQCQFCFCQDSNYTIKWPASTTPPTTGPTTISPDTVPTTTSQYIVVNNITYVELRNPCVLSYAMCPLMCDRLNVTFHGRMCENCLCPKQIFGKREETNFDSDLDTLTAMPTDFLDLICLPTPEFCPLPCNVITVTVDLWKCHTCRCPQGVQFIAMINPCDLKTQVCPVNCTVRQIDFLMNTCDICDCNQTNTNVIDEIVREGRILLDDTDIIQQLSIGSGVNCLLVAEDCPAHCHLVTVHSNSWQCHVCLCHGYVIPKTYVHHLTTYPTTKATSTFQHFFHLYSKETKLTTFGYSETSSQSSIQSTTANMQSTSSPVVETSQPYLTYSRKTIKTSEETTATTRKSLLETSVFTKHLLRSTHATRLRSTHITTTSLPIRTKPDFSKTIPKATSDIPLQGKTISCFICDVNTCNVTDLKLCDVGKSYCMNTFRDKVKESRDSRQIIRSCVSEHDCNDKWWLGTADDPICTRLLKGEHVDLKQDVECNVCCTENGCNKRLLLQDHLYVGNK